MIKIGHGFDSHKFKDGEFIILGGIKIPSKRAIVAHSDGDILIHALCDALLGAMGKGDLGSYFDSSKRFENISSLHFLKEVIKILNTEDYKIINIDATIITETPRISKYAQKIEKSLSKFLKIKEEQVNVKSKSNDNLGYIGRIEGIESHVVILIEK